MKNVYKSWQLIWYGDGDEACGGGRCGIGRSPHRCTGVDAPLAVVSFRAYKIGRDPGKASLGWLAGVFGLFIAADTAPFGIFTLIVAFTAVLSLII